MSLIDSFLKYKGWSRNNASTVAPLMPYIMADALYVAYESYIKGKVQQKVKHHANEMMKCYSRFNKDFFRAFNQEETDEVIERMDEFDNSLHNDFEILRMSIMSPLMKYPLEKQELISGLCLCKLLACHAEYLFSVVYRDQYGRRLMDANLAGIKHHACAMFREYSVKHGADNIDLSHIPEVEQSILNISTNMRIFLDKWEDENKEN